MQFRPFFFASYSAWSDRLMSSSWCSPWRYEAKPILTLGVMLWLFISTAVLPRDDMICFAALRAPTRSVISGRRRYDRPDRWLFWNYQYQSSWLTGRNHAARLVWFLWVVVRQVIFCSWHQSMHHRRPFFPLPGNRGHFSDSEQGNQYFVHEQTDPG